MSNSKNIKLGASTQPKKKRQRGKPKQKFKDVLTSEVQDVYTDPELVRIYQGIRHLESIGGTWRDYCFEARFFLGTGLRINEARHVRLEDIHMEYQTPVIYVVVGKGGTRRMTQVTPEFAPHLRRRVWSLARIPHADKVEGPFSWWAWAVPPKGWLFRSLWRAVIRRMPPHPLSDDALRKHWTWVLAECGVRYLPPHRGGRATFITQETERVPLHKLADTAGHSLAVMDQYYRRGIIGRNYSGPEDPPMWRGVA